MSIAKVKLDESTKIDFGVDVTGTDKPPVARFIIDGPDFSVSFPATRTNEGVEVDIRGLSKIFNAGEYAARLEIILDNKVYVPLEDTIEFEPSVAIKTKSKVVVGESVKVKVRAVETIEEEEEEEEDDVSEDELDDLANSVSDWEDIVDTYEPGELHIVDTDTGESVDDLHDELHESEDLNEVLSRVERIRSKIRFHRTSAKRERRLQIALKRRSSTATIGKRAHRMAIKVMKMRIARKPLESLSVSEKERIEGIIVKRKAIINRLAVKMTQRVRQIEKDRLTHTSTQDK